jgi:hypothetical protein
MGSWSHATNYNMFVSDPWISDRCYNAGCLILREEAAGVGTLSHGKWKGSLEVVLGHPPLR